MSRTLRSLMVAVPVGDVICSRNFPYQPCGKKFILKARRYFSYFQHMKGKRSAEHVNYRHHQRYIRLPQAAYLDGQGLASNTPSVSVYTASNHTRPDFPVDIRRFQWSPLVSDIRHVPGRGAHFSVVFQSLLTMCRQLSNEPPPNP